MVEELGDLEETIIPDVYKGENKRLAMHQLVQDSVFII